MVDAKHAVSTNRDNQKACLTGAAPWIGRPLGKRRLLRAARCRSISAGASERQPQPRPSTHAKTWQFVQLQVEFHLSAYVRRSPHLRGVATAKRKLVGFLTGAGAPARRLIAPAAARADCGVVALQRICIADVARVPQNLNARQQLDVTGGAAGRHHADAFALIGRGVFGPILLQRILRRRFVAETGFLITPENDRPAPGRLAARPDLERRRTAGGSPRVFCSRRCALGLPLPAGHIGRLPLPSNIRGQTPDVWLPMSDWRMLRRCPDRVLLGPSGARGDDSYRNAHANSCRPHDIAPFTKSVDTMPRHMRDANACRHDTGKELS
jgi:hypothetical protein